MDIFVKRLQLLLDENNINQKELAKKVGVTEVTISRYMTGERKPRIDIANKIAEYFNVSLDYLMGASDVRDPYDQEKHKDELRKKAKDSVEKEFKKEIEALDEFRNIMINKGFDYENKTYEELAQIIVKHIKIQDMLNNNDNESN
ncbi:helix-turn-helix domain-containing protein [Tissierella praeacuta]|uniref:helix-turn-helix domain-containing protein n=1 Tax=Tissierella praeacuta TaxID=43131 RepID=UPI001C0FB74F|nr:helix-turn-helix transcriptional regulator [Tissierella praeacuta]MBU5256813.1 helix-turn-helix transcriptional regulator [Tissierella praeacuta]